MKNANVQTLAPRPIEPAADGLVVMGSGVRHTIDGIVVRQKLVIRPGETELQNLHAWQVELIAQFDDID